MNQRRRWYSQAQAYAGSWRPAMALHDPATWPDAGQVATSVQERLRQRRGRRLGAITTPVAAPHRLVAPPRTPAHRGGTPIHVRVDGVVALSYRWTR
jgi:hypothetical protein